MTKNFFKDLTGFRDFSDACNRTHYHPVPDDWYVVLTDVQGSTKAIEAGRYKDVNMVGAACITAAVNASGDVMIPYVFGGDGATILVHESIMEDVKREMLAVKRFSEMLHDLPLRVGVVPIKDIKQRGKTIQIAKYEMETGRPLAMFRGGGVGLADDLVKYEGYTIESDNEDEPNLEGLSCRWQPIRPQRDKMLTLLVMSTSDDDLEEDVNLTITSIIDGDPNPVNVDGMTYSWPGWNLLRQSQMVWRRGNAFGNVLGHIFMIAFFNILNRFNLSVGDFDARQYRKDLITNSDYRKFDDALRMVVDCSHEQAKRVEDYLTALYDQGRIIYGTHYSKSALMTCFVTTTESDGHVHFVDGSDGGYAMAAKQLKAQMKNLKQKAA